MCAETLSEDCLYLNVFTPTTKPTKPLPVIVFIHGGAFQAGSASAPMFDAARLAKLRNVVFVTMNYRLNIFSGMYTGTVTGNYNIQDQRLALHWVQRNIAAFGGNPNLVTLSGQSAGAISTGIHLTSELSAGLFHRAIMMSNPFGLELRTVPLALAQGMAVLANVSCPAGGALELACLRALTPEQLLVASKVHDTTDKTPSHLLDLFLPWTPMVDAVDVPYQPTHAFRNGQFTRGIPIMLGTVANETVPFVAEIFPKAVAAWEFDLIVALIFGLSNKTAEGVIATYGAPPAAQKHDCRQHLNQLATDYLFYCANRYVVNKLADSATVYHWFFNHLPSYSKWIYELGIWQQCETAVCHADDIPLFFDNLYALHGGPSIPVQTPEEEALSFYMESAWRNFAETGDPNKGPYDVSAGGAAWPQYSMQAPWVKNLTVPVDADLLQDYRSLYCDYWDSIGYQRR